MYRHSDLAPAVMTTADVENVCGQHGDLAEGLAIVLSRRPEENGWDRDAYFDHDGFGTVHDAAIAEAKAWAKANQRFFKSEKLVDTVTDYLIIRWSAGWGK